MIWRMIERCERERGQDLVTEQSRLSFMLDDHERVRREHRPSREEDVVQRSTRIRRCPLLFFPQINMNHNGHDD